ncbi:MAG: discoidin domain-containing protein [Xanthobacteraceae bacterium]|nr:discoidin domain-containing protein [Xanthobacteraceae bacterium]
MAVMGVVLAIASFGLTLVLFDVLRPEDGEPGSLALVTAQNGLRLMISRSKKTGHGPERAFNGSMDADNFWESPGPFPMELTIEFPHSTILSNYTFRTDLEPSRMPSHWLVEGSEDGRKWSVLDEQKIDETWKSGESRIFSLRAQMSVRQLRLRFLRGTSATILRINKIEFH